MNSYLKNRYRSPSISVGGIVYFVFLLNKHIIRDIIPIHFLDIKPSPAPLASQQFVKDLIENIQGAAKCALAQLNELIPSGIKFYCLSTSSGVPADVFRKIV